jgi:hypothetical protein
MAFGNGMCTRLFARQENANNLESSLSLLLIQSSLLSTSSIVLRMVDQRSEGKRQHTLSLQLESIDRILRQTALMLNAGDQSSVNIDKHI